MRGETITADHVIETYLLRAERYPEWARRHVAARLSRLHPEHAATLAEYVALEAEIGRAEEAPQAA